jgi:HK97 family phage major capsid protein
MTEIIETGETPEDKRKRKIAEVRGILTEVRESESAAMREEFAGIIAEASRKPEEKPAESGVERALEAEPIGGDRGTPGIGGIKPMIDYRYEQMPNYMRKVRTVEGDAEIGRFMRALISKDTATLREMCAMTRVGLEAQYGRAVLAITEASHATSLMPIPLASAVISQVNATAVMRNVCTVYQSPNEQYRAPVFGKGTSAMVAEGAIATHDGGPLPANILLTKHKNQWAGSATEESVQDSNVNLASAVIEAAGNAIGYTEDVQVCTSAGTSPDFTGSIIEGVTDVSETTSGTLSFNDFNACYFGVPKPYRNGNAKIFGGAVVMQLLTGLGDAAGNRVMTPPTVGGQPVGDGPQAVGAIYGTQVFEVPLAAGILLIGDPKKYAMLTNPVMTIKQTDVAGWATDTVNFKVTLREDGILAFADAFRQMAGLTTI